MAFTSSSNLDGWLSFRGTVDLHDERVFEVNLTAAFHLTKPDSNT